ncbi:MAG: transposase [Flavobacteriales bacterium]|nr:transposase [Flavobacteriales bacterium]
MENSKELLELLLPSFIVNHFTFLTSSLDEDYLHLYFEEKNDTSLFISKKVESKGFHNEVIIEDFPLRGKLVYLHIKRRRWRDVNTKETLQRDWNSIAKGTRMTNEFATFLKEINRYQ